MFPTGPRGLPVLGNVLAFQKDALSFLLKAYQDYGDLVGLHFPRKPHVAVFGPRFVREVLVTQAKEVDDTSVGDIQLRQSIMGSGILNAVGSEHKQHRSFVQGAFSKQYMAEYQLALRENTRRILPTWSIGAELSLVPAIKHITTSNACRVLFGLTSDSETAHIVQAITALIATIDSPYHFLAASLLPIDIPGISQGGTVRKEIADLDLWLLKLAKEKTDAVSSLATVLLMEECAKPESDWNISRVRDNLIQLMFAGYHTTACSIVWTLYLLAQFPDICRMLLSELEQHLGGREPELADFAQMPYLDKVVKESLRLYPVGPYGTKLAYTTLHLDEWTLPQGTVILHSPWVTHRIPQIFPEPEQFMPDRFSTESEFPRGAYMPFGLGPRSCIGAQLATTEIKTVVCMVLQRFRLNLLPGQSIVAKSLPAVQPFPGIRVKVWVQDGETQKSSALIYGNVAGAKNGGIREWTTRK